MCRSTIKTSCKIEFYPWKDCVSLTWAEQHTASSSVCHKTKHLDHQLPHSLNTVGSDSTLPSPSCSLLLAMTLTNLSALGLFQYLQADISLRRCTCNLTNQCKQLHITIIASKTFRIAAISEGSASKNRQVCLQEADRYNSCFLIVLFMLLHGENRAKCPFPGNHSSWNTDCHPHVYCAQMLVDHLSLH